MKNIFTTFGFCLLFLSLNAQIEGLKVESCPDQDLVTIIAPIPDEPDRIYTYVWNGTPSDENTFVVDKSKGSVNLEIECSCGSHYSQWIDLSDYKIIPKVKHNTCNNSKNGSIHLDVKNNQWGRSFDYAWSDGGRGANRNELEAGTYKVTITDDQGCTQIKSYTIQEPKPIPFELETDAVQCDDLASGKAKIILPKTKKDETPFEVKWSSGGTDQMMEGLTEGVHTVQVYNDTHCGEKKFEINGSIPAQLVSEQKNYNGFGVSCESNADGQITIHDIHGGEGPVQILFRNKKINWTPGTPLTFDELEAGTHVFEIENEKGCIFLDSIEITKPPSLSIDSFDASTYGEYNICCSGNENGSLAPMVSGGAGQYTYAWTKNGEKISDTKNLENVGGGNYKLVVTDENGCETKSSYTLTEPSPININRINGMSLGRLRKVDFKAKGGSGKYEMVVSGDVNKTNKVKGFSVFKVVPKKGLRFELEVQDENQCRLFKKFFVAARGTSTRTKKEKDARPKLYGCHTKKKKKGKMKCPRL